MTKKLLLSGLAVSLFGIMGVAKADDAHTVPKITASKAISVAKADAKNGNPYSVEIDRFGRASVYEVKLSTGKNEVEYKINTDDGKVLDKHSEADDDVFPSVKVSLLDAIKKAESKNDGFFVADAELDEEDGKLVYEIKLYSKTDESAMKKIDVDANTGEIRAHR